MKQRAFALVVSLILGAISTEAHHAISSYYDSNRPVTVQGVVTEFRFVNPHPFVFVAVTDAKGASQQWKLEMDNRGELAGVGMTNETLKSGDRVVVTGSLARNEGQSLYIRKLERPADGFVYEQVGSSPRVTRHSTSRVP